MNYLRIPAMVAAMIAFASTATLAAIRPPFVRTTTMGIPQHSYSGTLQSRRHLVLTLRLRTGKIVIVDATQAYLKNKVTQPLTIGEPLLAQGILIAGVLIATSAVKTTANAYTWSPDR